MPTQRNGVGKMECRLLCGYRVTAVLTQSGVLIYTDDSSIGTAAVHAGIIDFETGGIVTIEIRPGQESYQGSTRNGVTTEDYGSYAGSYVFVVEEEEPAEE